MTNAKLVMRESTSGMTPAILVVGLILSTLTLWSFAFWHAPEATPEWLTRAQAACFGISETGLPNVAGWVVLVLTPLSFLAVAIVMYGWEIVWGLRCLLSSVTGRLFAVLLISSVIAEGVWVTGRIRHGLSVAQASYIPEAGIGLPEHYPRLNELSPPFALRNQRGELVELSALRGRTILLTFAFAHCQTICPAVVQQALTAARNFPPDSLYLLIVTLDPWRDTPSALPGLATRWELRENEHVLWTECFNPAI